MKAKTIDNTLSLPKELSEQIVSLKTALSKPESVAVAAELGGDGECVGTLVNLQDVERDVQAMLKTFLQTTLHLGPEVYTFSLKPGWRTQSDPVPTIPLTLFEDEALSVDKATENEWSWCMNESELSELAQSITGGLCYSEENLFPDADMPRGPFFLF